MVRYEAEIDALRTEYGVGELTILPTVVLNQASVTLIDVDDPTVAVAHRADERRDSADARIARSQCSNRNGALPSSIFGCTRRVGAIRLASALVIRTAKATAGMSPGNNGAH